MVLTAVITGASGGIGRELAREFARDGHDLVLVARSEEKLRELARELGAQGITAHILPLDLSDYRQAREIYDFCRSMNLDVAFLVNNAGFGDFGLFHLCSWEKQEAMINLNITALTYLTRLFLPDLVSRGAGRILNVASTAAFQPGPAMSVYYASKAYVLHFSEAIANELEGSGVTVTALCPGATQSGFQEAAAMEESRLVKGRRLPTSASVAAYGYRALMRGRTVAIPGWRNRVMALGYRLLPRKWIVRVTRRLQYG